MKKLGSFLIPIGMFLLLSMLGTRLLASGTVDMTTFGIIAIVLVLVLIFSRSKKTPTKSADAVKDDLLDGYAVNAFAVNEELGRKFDAILNDIGKNMPKAALAKLEKLAPQCTSEKEKYAVALVTAKLQFRLQKFNNAILAYTQALVLRPSGELSVAVGDCHQRLGNLDEARDSYEFAIDLDPKNTDARSRLATTYVADWDYETALEYAEQVLDLEENNASALATAAICHGMLGDTLMRSHYTKRAVENGYSEKKITETIDTLKKRSK